MIRMAFAVAGKSRSMVCPRRCSSLLPMVLAACLGTPSGAAPPDRDYETITPRPPSAVSVPAPPGFAGSPLIVAEHAAGPSPRRRFVLKDGSVMVGQVLGFDGRMYALRLPHETVLVRRDLLAAVTPLPAVGAHKTSARPARAGMGARY